MERKIFAILDVDEEVLLEKEDGTIGDRFEQEMGWVANSGITINSWMFMDKDEDDLRQQYRNYLVEWVDRQSFVDEQSSPLPFEKWQIRPIMLANSNIAVSLIEDLGNGEPTQLGERTSTYFMLAKSRETLSEPRYCRAALIEREHVYELHVINDIDMSNCCIYECDRDDTHLRHLLAWLLKKIKEMTDCEL